MAMAARRFLQTLVANRSSCSYDYGIISRSIASSPRLESMGWFDKIKSAVTGKGADPQPDSFSLIYFAEQMDKARKLGTFKNFVMGRCSEATISNAFEKHSAILRYLGSIDATGENLTNSHKSDAVKHCNCTIADVEHILAKYSWAKEAQRKIDKLKEEGKPLPKSFSENKLPICCRCKSWWGPPLWRLVGKTWQKLAKLVGMLRVLVDPERDIKGVVELIQPKAGK
ncbi:SEC-C motif protein isoform X1 [Carex rostrata]